MTCVLRSAPETCRPHGGEKSDMGYTRILVALKNGGLLSANTLSERKSSRTSIVLSEPGGRPAVVRSSRSSCAPRERYRTTKPSTAATAMIQTGIISGEGEYRCPDDDEHSVPWCQRGLRSQSDPSHHHESTGPAAACALQGPAFLVRAAAKSEWQGLLVSPVAD